MFSGTAQANRDVHRSVTTSRVSVWFTGFRMRVVEYLGTLLVLSLVVASPCELLAQSKKKTKPPRNSEPTLAQKLAAANAEVVATTNDYKAKLAKVLELQERDVKALAEMLEKRKALLAESIISKKEVDEAEQALAVAQSKAADTQKQMTGADNLIAEVKAEEQLAKLGPSRVGSYQTTAALIRYNGTASWVLTDAAKVQSFFALRFNQALPISAFGQTAVHNQMGFDHRNSIDVAVTPDSAEGQTLMAYLRNAGIPFIAFRHAVRGSATGAHIHIGYPSKRVSR